MATKLKKQKFFFANWGLEPMLANAMVWNITIVHSTLASLFTIILIGLFNVYLLGFILAFVFYPFTAVDTLFWKWICSNNIKRTIFSIDSSNFISEHLVHYWNSLFKLWMRNWISYWRNTKTTWNKFLLLLVYRINALSELQS